MRKITLFLLLSMLLAAFAFPAAAGAAAPNFTPQIYADGQAWGTKGVTALPAPTDHNRQSFDKLFAFTNGADGQLPVSEAGPGNPAYNGGRWLTYTVTWTAEGMAAHDPLPVLKSYDEIMLHEGLGHLTVQEGTFSGGPMPYFECPLLPVKE